MMNCEPVKSFWAGDAPAPGQRPDKPSPPAVPKNRLRRSGCGCCNGSGWHLVGCPICQEDLRLVECLACGGSGVECCGSTLMPGIGFDHVRWTGDTTAGSQHSTLLPEIRQSPARVEQRYVGGEVEGQSPSQACEMELREGTRDGFDFAFAFAFDFAFATFGLV